MASTPFDFVAEGLRKKLIRFEDDKKYVIYVDQAKRRRYEARRRRPRSSDG